MTKLRSPVHKPPRKRPAYEQPLPDWAPFSVPSDEVWRDLQRRRNLISMVRALIATARDEGYTTCAALLEETAARLAFTLIDGNFCSQTRTLGEPSAAGRVRPDPTQANAKTDAAIELLTALAKRSAASNRPAPASAFKRSKVPRSNCSTSSLPAS